MESMHSVPLPPLLPLPLPQLIGRRSPPRNLPPRLSRAAPPQKPPVMCRWVPPPADEISINCDASVRNDRIGLGCIGRNHIGAVVFAVATARRNRVGNSVVYHELEAILRGLQEDFYRDFSTVRVFSDSLMSVQILNGDKEADSSCHHLIFQIATAASMLRSVSFSFTYREANSPADFLSKYCHPDEFEWVSDDSMAGDYPEEFQYLLCIDAFGMFHLRKLK